MSFEWVKDYQCFSSVLEGLDWIKERKIEGTYLALYSHQVVCGVFKDFSFFPDIIEDTLLLELRIFSKKEEIKFMRPLAEGEFYMRWIQDEILMERLKVSAGSNFEKTWENRVFDEIHYLDRAGEVKNKDNTITYTTTGGGCYTLPFPESKRKVKVRSYLNYEEENGMLQIDDWRIVEFLAEGEEDGI